MNDTEKLSQRMKYYRQQKRLKIVECAQRVGVSPSTYRDWELGRSIRGEPYQRIAEALEISTSRLLGLNENEMAQDKLIEFYEDLEKLKEKVKKVISDC